MRQFVQEAMNTRSTFTSVIGVPGVSPRYEHALQARAAGRIGTSFGAAACSSPSRRPRR